MLLANTLVQKKWIIGNKVIDMSKTRKVLISFNQLRFNFDSIYFIYILFEILSSKSFFF